MRLIVSLLCVFLVAGGIWWWFGHDENALFERVNPPLVGAPLVEESRTPSTAVPVPTPESPKRVVTSVERSIPFTSQAPTGDWSQSAFQDGCEEASALMVWMAREGRVLAPLEVKAKLLDMAAFQTRLIGHGVDTDAADTAEYLLEQYFGITDARVEHDPTLEDIQLALQDGLVIIPTNGRALENPNFTPPGPLQHMLVITGYDRQAREFITNDPGTRKGEKYRYPEQVLYDAIREYPTGKHLPITTERKAMIVVPFSNQS